MSQFYSNNNAKLLATIHKLNCMLDNVENFKDDDVIMEYVLERQSKEDFHIIPGMKDEKCATLVCRICNNDKLVVGQTAFFTAVKCGNCGYEIAVHQG